jgi:hypothetical protein
VWTNDLLTFTNNRIRDQIHRRIASRTLLLAVGVPFDNAVWRVLTHFKVVLDRSRQSDAVLVGQNVAGERGARVRPV